MSKLVVLELDGTFEVGFRIILEIYREAGTKQPPASPTRLKSKLQANPVLASSLQDHWQEKYRILGAPYRRKREAFRIKPQKIVHRTSRDRQLEDCRNSAKQLRVHLNQWLDREDFRPVEKQLRSHLDPEEEIRFLIRTEDRQLQKLPWQEWELFENYPHAETALCPPELKSREAVSSRYLSNKVRILAILGHDEGIDVERDRQTLQALPHAEVIFLVCPRRSEVVEQIWENTWEIIFFAGHSETEGETGRIYLNESESLTIDELWFGLKKAVDRGLQLAIFNSCDGLGLSDRLDDLQIPQMIVMRELVPDLVAQRFLTHFLRNFSSGCSFYRAVREAKQRLHDELEPDFPCASWLPVICQTPNIIPPAWDDLRESEVEEEEKTEQKKERISTLKSTSDRRLLILFSLAIAGLIIGVRSLGWLQGWELNHFDLMLRLRPAEPRDDRFLVVTIGEDDRAYQDNLNMNRRDSLSPEALELFWEKVKPYRPKIIALNIHDFMNDTQQNAELLAFPFFLASCHNSTEEIESIPSPSNIPLSRIGFANVVDDQDGVIRRQIIAKRTKPLCQAPRSFSFEIAQHYLQKEAQLTSADRIQLGDIKIDLLTTTTGGYKLSSSQAGGLQTLINYRRVNPQQVSLTEIISGSRDAKMADLVKDKILIIGKDRHIGYAYYTPYSKSKKVSSTMLHTQMASQLISAVLDERPLFKEIPNLLENILIILGTLLGSSSLMWKLKNKYKLFILGSAMGVLLFVGYQGLVLGFWIPLIPISIGISVTPFISSTVMDLIKQKGI